MKNRWLYTSIQCGFLDSKAQFQIP